MVKEREKLKVIFTIDKMITRIGETIYGREMKMMRKKYIYKDISNSEFKKDVLYLRSVKEIIKCYGK